MFLKILILKHHAGRYAVTPITRVSVTHPMASRHVLQQQTNHRDGSRRDRRGNHALKASDNTDGERALGTNTNPTASRMLRDVNVQVNARLPSTVYEICAA